MGVVWGTTGDVFAGELGHVTVYTVLLSLYSAAAYMCFSGTDGSVGAKL